MGDTLPEGKELMHYAGKKVTATGYYLQDTDEFVVLKGSEFSKTETNSCAASTHSMRQKLIDEGVVENYIFVKSVKFSSRSTAAQMVYGGSQNGRIMWVNDEGKPV